MRAGDGERLHAEVASVLDWWTLAGVTSPVAESPRDWLAPPAKAAPASPAAPPPPAAAPFPATLDDFLAWLADDADAALFGPADARLAPAGDRAAPLMVLVDMPTPDDADAGALLSGPAGRLLDRMLAAIGTARPAIWLAPLCPVRPTGGRLPPERLARLGAIARHHIRLVAPKRVLLMGAPAAEGVLGLPLAEARGTVHDRDGRQVVATFSPQILLGAPAMKPGAWADLRQFVEGDAA